MASTNVEVFDLIGELILMKGESKEDEEHVRVSLHYSYSYVLCFFLQMFNYILCNLGFGENFNQIP